jgi:hypothetical protein
LSVQIANNASVVLSGFEQFFRQCHPRPGKLILNNPSVVPGPIVLSRALGTGVATAVLNPGRREFALQLRDAHHTGATAFQNPVSPTTADGFHGVRCKRHGVRRRIHGGWRCASK